MGSLKTIKDEMEKSIRAMEEKREFYRKLTEAEIIEKADSLNWKFICQCTPLDIVAKLAKDYADDISWDIICRRDLPKDFIDEFQKEILRTLYKKYR